MSRIYCDECVYYRVSDYIREMTSDDGLCMFHPPSVIPGPEGSIFADVARPRVRRNDFCALAVEKKK